MVTNAPSKFRPLDQRPSSAPSHLLVGQLSPWCVAGVACLSGACVRASRLARSLAFSRCVYAVARRAASPFPLFTGREGGGARGGGSSGSVAWLRLVRVERSPPERCCVMELLCALSAQRSADAQAAASGAWRGTGVGARALVVQDRCSRGSGQGYGVWLAQGFNAGLWCTCSFGDRNREDQKLP